MFTCRGQDFACFVEKGSEWLRLRLRVAFGFRVVIEFRNLFVAFES